MFAPIVGAWQSICGFFHDATFLIIGALIGFVVGYIVSKFK
jgi:hypothetical protein